jgi:hypothetical protein
MSKYYILFCILFFSCNSKTAKQEQELLKPKMSIIQKHNSIVLLENSSKNYVANWTEYQSVNEHLKKFSSISANEALNNALKLSDLVKLLKDSIRPEELINLPFRTRINVLDNEALRLKDMTFIPAITANEVTAQVEKIIAAFSATNSKINTVYTQLEVEKDLKNNLN